MAVELPSADASADQVRVAGGDRVLLVVPADDLTSARDELTLLELWEILWQDKWVVIAIIIASMAASVTYALAATQWYRAEVLLVPAKQSANGIVDRLGGLSSLASIAGIDIGENDSSEPIAVLKSRDFTRAFIEEQNLLPVLFASKWDAAASAWKSAAPDKIPDLRDAVKLFDEKIRSVSEDSTSGLVTLSVEWTDAAIAAKWANLLVDRLNSRMRERALVEAEQNISYLRQELAQASVVTLQQSVGRLLESEMQKMMVARSSSEYSFRFVDRADVPKWRSKPNRPLVAILGTLAGCMLSVLVAFLRFNRQKRAS